MRRSVVFGRRDVVTSFRVPPKEILSGLDDARLLQYFRSAPRGAGRIFWSYYHEPDAAVTTGELTAPQFIAAFRHIADLAQEACNPKLFPTLILTGWAPENRHIDWEAFYPGDDYVSVMAWDPYNRPVGRARDYAAPSTIFSPAIRASHEAGKPWGIAETGSNLVPGDSGARRARWLLDVGRYLLRYGATFVCYFQSTHGHDFMLRDRPSVQAWRSLVSSTSQGPAAEMGPSR